MVQPNRLIIENRFSRRLLLALHGFIGSRIRTDLRNRIGVYRL